MQIILEKYLKLLEGRTPFTLLAALLFLLARCRLLLCRSAVGCCAESVKYIHLCYAAENRSLPLEWGPWECWEWNKSVESCAIKPNNELKDANKQILRGFITALLLHIIFIVNLKLLISASSSMFTVHVKLLIVYYISDRFFFLVILVVGQGQLCSSKLEITAHGFLPAL